MRLFNYMNISGHFIDSANYFGIIIIGKKHIIIDEFQDEGRHFLVVMTNKSDIC